MDDIRKETIDFMEVLGFEFHDGEYYKYFTKNEGTCEVTLDGAVEMLVSHRRMVDQAGVKARCIMDTIILITLASIAMAQIDGLSVVAFIAEIIFIYKRYILRGYNND